MAQSKDREYLTAIDIDKGIIKLIDPKGLIVIYRQRGIQKLPEQVINSCILKKILYGKWKSIPELPRNWSISFEDPEIQGRALATFPVTLEYERNKRNKTANK